MQQAEKISSPLQNSEKLSPPKNRRAQLLRNVRNIYTAGVITLVILLSACGTSSYEQYSDSVRPTIEAMREPTAVFEGGESGYTMQVVGADTPESPPRMPENITLVVHPEFSKVPEAQKYSWRCVFPSQDGESIQGTCNLLSLTPVIDAATGRQKTQNGFFFFTAVMGTADHVIVDEQPSTFSYSKRDLGLEGSLGGGTYAILNSVRGGQLGNSDSYAMDFALITFEIAFPIEPDLQTLHIPPVLDRSRYAAPPVQGDKRVGGPVTTFIYPNGAEAGLRLSGYFDPDRPWDTFIVSSGAIDKGASGAAIYDEDGNLIGFISRMDWSRDEEGIVMVNFSLANIFMNFIPK
ncbi:MAG: hypothetical protein WAU07_05790 [Microgenomates group bacterium]